MADAKVAMMKMPVSPKTLNDWADWIDDRSDRHATHAVKLTNGEWVTVGHERPPFGRLGMLTVDELDQFADMIRRAAEVLGPECPKCGRFMKAEHAQNYTDLHVLAVYRTRWGIGERVTGKPCFSAFELAAQYPEIAKAIGIDVTPAEATENERREG